LGKLGGRDHQQRKRSQEKRDKISITSGPAPGKKKHSASARRKRAKGAVSGKIRGKRLSIVRRKRGGGDGQCGDNDEKLVICTNPRKESAIRNFGAQKREKPQGGKKYGLAVKKLQKKKTTRRNREIDLARGQISGRKSSKIWGKKWLLKSEKGGGKMRREKKGAGGTHCLRIKTRR